jgi:hypothetical protein
MTLEQAKSLKSGQVIFHTTNKNADGTAQRWKVNGAVKIWKRNPNRIYIPVKHGLYRYDFITEEHLDLVTID